MNSENSRQRQWSLTVLSKSKIEDIQKYWKEINVSPVFHFLKKPQVGMVMVRAKAGTGGQNFNMGEMTVTQCVVQLDTNQIGYGYTKGRDKEKSELVALIDACLQVESMKKNIIEKIIDPLNASIQNMEKELEDKVEQSKVNFFTMVRGE